MKESTEPPEPLPKQELRFQIAHENAASKNLFVVLPSQQQQKQKKQQKVISKGNYPFQVFVLFYLVLPSVRPSVRSFVCLFTEENDLKRVPQPYPKTLKQFNNTNGQPD